MKGRYFLNHKGNVPELEPKDSMKLFFVYFIILFVFACILFFNIKRSEAFVPDFRGLTSDGKFHSCVELHYNTRLVPTCYAKIKGKLVNIGSQVTAFTGIYDSKGKKIYEGDRVSTPGYQDGMVIWESNEYLYGYYIWIGNDIYYYFRNLEGQPKSTWSTKLSENYNKK